MVDHPLLMLRIPSAKTLCWHSLKIPSCVCFALAALNTGAVAAAINSQCQLSSHS